MADNLLEKTEEDLPQIDEQKDYLSDLVGEGRRFKDAQSLAKGKAEADQMIEIFKKRMDQMREDYLKVSEENKSRASLQEMLDQLKQERLTSNDETTVKEVHKPAINPDEIKSLVSTNLNEFRKQEKETENFNQVKNKLQERFGKNYSEKLSQQIEQLGLTVEEANALAKRSPTAFARTFGLDQQVQQETFDSPPRSRQRIDNFAPTSAKKRTWSYYQELKKTKPDLYFDPKVAVQMQQDAIEQGETFRDGDYYVRGLHDKY